jgi:hypothetical protein
MGHTALAAHSWKTANMICNVLTLSGWATVHTVSLDQTHQDDLGGQGGDDALCVDQGGVAQVVQSVTSEDLCSGLEPGGLSELDSGVPLQQLWGDASQGSQHGLHTASYSVSRDT